MDFMNELRHMGCFCCPELAQTQRALFDSTFPYLCADLMLWSWPLLTWPLPLKSVDQICINFIIMLYLCVDYVDYC